MVAKQTHAVRGTGYVSEFTQFIDAFLHEHPEVVEDQRRGWNIYWTRHHTLEELKEAEADTVPIKGYYPDQFQIQAARVQDKFK